HSSDYCFRKYASVEESYRDHSIFLSQRSRYVKLFYYPITDYKSWAQGLKDAGYSGNPRYADTLISIIEKYFLMHYDRKVAQKIGDSSALRTVAPPKLERVDQDIIHDMPKEKPSSRPATPQQPAQQQQQPQPVQQPKPVTQNPTPPAQNAVNETATNAQPSTKPEKVHGKNVFTLNPYSVPYKSAYYPYTSRPAYENNKTKFIIAKAGDTYKKLAAALQLSEKNLRLYNDVYDNSEPIEDEVIYVEMKSTRTPVEYHTLEEGDTYRYIAQKYGIQLKLLIKRNSGAISSYGIGDKICLGCK
ncbi:MAG: LysM peptidoglycan-binding domain-containing protein, partial [Bacteroidales bacterium]|nr:LysM peptidoglycan-binding domain-containing protein [Bacteroidales bacterium]